MKTFMKMAVCIMIVALAAVSCKKKEEAPVQEPVKEVYTPKHTLEQVDLSNLKTYNYISAPAGAAAVSVAVEYSETELYTPIKIKYKYANGDTRTYVLDGFGLWANEAGRLRVVADQTTVWLQGQTKAGKFCEVVFYGDPKNNGKKIKPNSYRNLPAGEIVYR